MASGPIRDPKTDDLLTPQNSALVIIDYQPLQVNSIASMDRNLLVNHIVAVAKTGVGFRLPIVHSTVNVGLWTVAMGRSAATFTKPMQSPDGKTITPTGKRFETFFTTIAKSKNDQIVEEYVMLDPRDIMKQVVA